MSGLTTILYVYVCEPLLTICCLNSPVCSEDICKPVYPQPYQSLHYPSKCNPVLDVYLDKKTAKAPLARLTLINPRTESIKLQITKPGSIKTNILEFGKGKRWLNVNRIYPDEPVHLHSLIKICNVKILLIFWII